MKNFIPLLVSNLDRLSILGLMSASLLLAGSFYADNDSTTLYLLKEFFFPIYYSSVILVGVTRIVEFMGLYQSNADGLVAAQTLDQDPFLHTMPMKRQNWNRLARRRRREFGNALETLQVKA
jgi:hypothetical protein